VNLPMEFQKLGSELERALKELADRNADVKGRYSDQQIQLGATVISINATRAEVLERLDRVETKVLTEFEKLNAKLDRALAAAEKNGETK
jgi:hypothetical protein